MKAVVDLSQWSSMWKVGQNWRFVGQRFYKFQSDTAYFGGQFCVSMQIRPNSNQRNGLMSMYDYVQEQSKPICLPYAQPNSYGEKAGRK